MSTALSCHRSTDSNSVEMSRNKSASGASYDYDLTLNTMILDPGYGDYQKILGQTCQRDYLNVVYNCQDFTADFIQRCREAGLECRAVTFDCGTRGSAHALAAGIVRVDGIPYYQIFEPQREGPDTSMRWPVDDDFSWSHVPDDVRTKLCAGNFVPTVTEYPELLIPSLLGGHQLPLAVAIVPSRASMNIDHEMSLDPYKDPSYCAQFPGGGERNDCNRCCDETKKAYHAVDDSFAIFKEKQWLVACHDSCREVFGEHIYQTTQVWPSCTVGSRVQIDKKSNCVVTGCTPQFKDRWVKDRRGTFKKIREISGYEAQLNCWL